jgi:chemotaxis signal transduction protein
VTAVEAELAQRLAELRQGFDRGFAAPPATATAATVGLLAIRIAAGSHAIRMGEISEVQPAPRLVTLPGARPEMMGLAGIRGRLVPVYNLAALLGHDEPGTKNWVAVCGMDEPLGIGFDELEGYIQVLPTDLYPAAEVERSRGQVREVLHRDGASRMVVSVSSIVSTLRLRDRSSTRGP